GKDAARLDDRCHLAERLELPLFAGRSVVQHASLDVDVQFVAGADLLAQALATLERDQVAAVDRVAEKDAGVELGDDGVDARCLEGDRGVLARAAAAEIAPGDDDLVRRHKFVVGVEWYVSLRQPALRRWDARESVLAELLV